jgi:hypothetical protein
MDSKEPYKLKLELLDGRSKQLCLPRAPAVFGDQALRGALRRDDNFLQERFGCEDRRIQFQLSGNGIAMLAQRLHLTVEVGNARPTRLERHRLLRRSLPT